MIRLIQYSYESYIHKRIMRTALLVHLDTTRPNGSLAGMIFVAIDSPEYKKVLNQRMWPATWILGDHLGQTNIEITMSDGI